MFVKTNCLLSLWSAKFPNTLRRQVGASALNQHANVCNELLYHTSNSVFCASTCYVVDTDARPCCMCSHAPKGYMPHFVGQPQVVCTHIQARFSLSPTMPSIACTYRLEH